MTQIVEETAGAGTDPANRVAVEIAANPHDNLVTSDEDGRVLREVLLPTHR
jgi:hypothetical protein